MDPAGIIARLKQQAADYPPRLKARITDDSLWGARFTLDHASKFAARGDVYNTAGCLTRIASGLTQALFAINEVYWVTDKRAMAAVTAFAASPDDYADRLASILAEPGSSPAGLERSVTEMSVLFGEVASLAGEFYRQRYALG